MTGNGDHILPAEDKSIVALFLFFFLSVFGQKKKKKRNEYMTSENERIFSH